MPFTVYVRMKKLGKQKSGDLEPVPFLLEERPKTIRELLTGLTELLVRAYNERKDEGQMLSYLTKEEIADQAARGKISFGLRGGADADSKEAVDHTIQCFEDGIYRVFAGEEELTGLTDPIPLTDDPVFTFVRLTMLSGW